MSTRKQKKTKPAGKPSKGAARKTPKTTAAASAPASSTTTPRDPRLPAPGTTLIRPYKGKDVRVKVLDDGFEYEGALYRSLSAIGRIVTGYGAISGPAFFRLTGAPATPKGAKSKDKPAAPKGDAAESAPAAESATA